MRPVAHRARLVTTTNTRALAADLLQMQPPETIGSSIDCTRGSEETTPFPTSRMRKTQLSFRDGPSGPGPEPMNTGQALDFLTRCSWMPGSRARPVPRNDDLPVFFRNLLV